LQVQKLGQPPSLGAMITPSRAGFFFNGPVES
jgi:hypothetical protein